MSAKPATATPNNHASVANAPMLSQTTVKTINQRCLELVRKLACLENVRRDFADPILTWARQEQGMALAAEPVQNAWMLLRQGGSLCYLLNRLRSNTITTVHPIDEPLSKDYFRHSKTALANVTTFLKACKEDLYMKDDELFDPLDLFRDNTNALSKTIGIAEALMKKIFDTQRFMWDKRAEKLMVECPELYGDAAPSDDAAGQGARDKRLLVIDELLDTERKYVADLELLQRFAEECRIDNVIDAETHIALFANLDQLLDFQRKFLITMEGPLTAATRSLSSSYEAHIGRLFVEHEHEFGVYDAFCANHRRASEMTELMAAHLSQKAQILDPRTQLPSFLIKPVQRVCKYPLLIRELLKQSDPQAPDRSELEAAYEAMKRVGDRVNEKQRRAENAIVAAEFIERVEDWRELRKGDLGDLVLHGTLIVSQTVAGDKPVEKELQVFLFSNVLVLAKEGKGSMLISALSRQRKTAATPLVIKGHVSMRQFTIISREGADTIRLSYRDKSETILQFALRCRNEEMASKWSVSLLSLTSQYGVKAADTRAQPTVFPGGILVDKAARRKSRMVLADERKQVPMAIPTTATQQAVHPEMRLKVVFSEDVYLLLVVDIPSLAELRRLALGKIKADYAATGRKFDFSEDGVRLKYLDGDDQVVLVDEGDLAEAIEMHTNELKVFIYPQSKP